MTGSSAWRRTCSRESQVKNHRSKITGQKSQVKNHRSKITGQKSQVKNHRSGSRTGSGTWRWTCEVRYHRSSAHACEWLCLYALTVQNAVLGAHAKALLKEAHKEAIHTARARVCAQTHKRPSLW